MAILFKKSNSQQRLRGNKTAGRSLLILIFLCVAASNLATASILFYTGDYTVFYKGGLFLGTVWTAVLLLTIWNRHDWARVVLVVFLLFFVALQFLFLPDIIQRNPNFQENCLKIILIHWAVHILSAIYLLTSVDIRWLARDEIND